MRALDMQQWWNLEAPLALRHETERPPRSVARNGVTDRSLYRRVHPLQCAVGTKPMR